MPGRPSDRSQLCQAGAVDLEHLGSLENGLAFVRNAMSFLRPGGVAVHTASRIMNLAEPGRVLASSTVRDLVAGSNLRFEDAGVHTLKGLPDQVRLFWAS